MSGHSAPPAPPPSVYRSFPRQTGETATTPSVGAGRFLRLAAAGVLLSIAVAVEFTQTRALHGSAFQIGMGATGLLVALLAFVPIPTGLGLASQKICISIVTLAAMLLCLEGLCRAVRYDFIGEERAWRRIPLFFRWPVIPTGEAFFRRNGPERWTGRPLFERLAQLHVSPNPYRSDPPITATYDTNGFRNDAGLTDWEIAVAGDSFTELGYLKQEELFTSVLGKQMGVRVRNLGTSYTGPLSQLSYLRSYGIGSSTKRAVIVFYEGNDLDDLKSESALLAQFRQSGQRPVREFRKQTSLLQTLFQLMSGRAKLSQARGWPQEPPQKSWVTGYFKSAQGDRPITLTTTPPSGSQIPPETMKQLDSFFAEFADFGRERGLEVWSAYMPCKERVVHGLVEFSPDAPESQKQWQPTDLPQIVSTIAREHGVKFMNLTSALISETERRKQLLYNGIWDTHLTAEGSVMVGKEMARVLSSPP